MRAGLLTWRFAGQALVILVLLFLYLPIFAMILMAFNNSPYYTLPIRWSVVWFDTFFHDQQLLVASRNSLLIALATTVIAGTLGTLAALGLARYRFRGRSLLRILLLPPIAIPWLITGTAMLILAFWTGLGRGLHTILIGHVALSLPYVIMVVGSRIAGHGVSLEEAAATLGAGPLETFRRITLPVIAPAIIAGALFAFATSFDMFVVSYFLAAPGMTTLPVEIYAAIKEGFTPEINAVSTILIAISAAIVLAIFRFHRIGTPR
jgi:spermidine/putrescine transport system permease protein